MNHSILALLLVLGASFFSGTAWAQIAPNPAGKQVEVNGVSIYYEEYGQGEPLLLLHGFGRTLEDWAAMIPAYAEHYRVIAWDMRGHGRSTGLDSGLVFLHAQASEDLLALIRKLNLEKVKAIGHSSGGIVILGAATQAPQLFESIVPVSAQTFFGPEVRKAIQEIAQPEEYYQFNDMEKLHGPARGMLLSRQFYHFHELQGDPNISPEQLKRITAKTLIVHGDNDFVPVSQAWLMYQSIPQARLWVVPNGWHMPHIGPTFTPDFIRNTLEFLKGDWNPSLPDSAR